TNTIDLGARHGLFTGDTVTYSNGGNASIGGLSNGRTYGVVYASDTTLKLGAAFTPTTTFSPVSVANDTITFASPHHLLDGDRVIYSAPVDDPNTAEDEGGLAVGGLTSGNVYVVRRIDDRTIKLMDPSHAFDA